jgi:alcohol dehydrogenase class IV
MPYVLRFNESAIAEKIARLGRYLGLAKPGFAGFLDWVLELRQKIGIPHTLSQLGVKTDHLERFSKMASEDPTAGGNPVKAGVPEMRTMYEAALAGRL